MEDAEQIEAVNATLNDTLTPTAIGNLGWISSLYSDRNNVNGTIATIDLLFALGCSRAVNSCSLLKPSSMGLSEALFP